MGKHTLSALLISVFLVSCVSSYAKECVSEFPLELETQIRIRDDKYIVVENEPDSSSIVCSYLAGDVPDFSAILTDQVGKLSIKGGAIQTISDEVHPYTGKLTQLLIRDAELKEISLDAFNSSNNIKTLDLSFNQISNISFITGKFKNLQILNLKNNLISSIKNETLRGLTQLNILELSNNTISSLNWFSSVSLGNLQIFSLKNNSLSEIKDFTFSRKHELHTLDMAYNELSDINGNMLHNLTSLAYLNLKFNRLETIPPSTFFALPNLKMFVLTGNRLKTFTYYTDKAEIPSDEMEGFNYPLQSFPSVLEKLRLESNDIQSVSPEMQASIKRMRELLHIHLENNSISYLPSRCFDGLQKLTTIGLNTNPITKMAPDAFTNLPSLTELSFYTNNQYLVVDFTQCEGLVSMLMLDLVLALVIEIKSPLLECLPNLIRLDLRQNMITHADFFTTVGHKNEHLKYIDLSMNRIEQIDENTFGAYIEEVEFLDLHQNMLLSFDLSSLAHVHKLIYLDLSFNHMETVTAAKAKRVDLLQDLRYLNLSSNHIQSLDYFQNIHFASLEVMQLTDNDLSTLPTCLFADAHRPDSFDHLDYSRNGIFCDCKNAWLREINSRVRSVLASQCKGGEFYGDTFPIANCQPEDVHKLDKIRCTAGSKQPSLGVLVVFALSNLFLFTLIAGGYVKKRWREKQARNNLPSDMSRILSSGIKSANRERKSTPSHHVNQPFTQVDEPELDRKSEIVDEGKMRSSFLLRSSGSGLRHSSAAGFGSNPKLKPLKQTGARLSKPAGSRKIKLDEELHADLIRKLLHMEQMDHGQESLPTSPNTPTSLMSHHASYENIRSDANPHHIFLNTMKNSQSADGIPQNLTDDRDIRGKNSQILRVYNASVANTATGSEASTQHLELSYHPPQSPPAQSLPPQKPETSPYPMPKPRLPRKQSFGPTAHEARRHPHTSRGSNTPSPQMVAPPPSVVTESPFPLSASPPFHSPDMPPFQGTSPSLVEASFFYTADTGLPELSPPRVPAAETSARRLESPTNYISEYSSLASDSSHMMPEGHGYTRGPLSTLQEVFSSSPQAGTWSLTAGFHEDSSRPFSDQQ